MDRSGQHGTDLLRLYDTAVVDVHRYLHARCGDRQLAEELTADTFLAAVGQIRRCAVEDVSTAWLIGIARHKLLDHWRRRSRRPIETEAADDHDPPPGSWDDPWDAVVEERRVADVLDALGAHHRSALVLRYVDGLPVPEVAEHLGRTVHATEALLVRARAAFRAAYERTQRP